MRRALRRRSALRSSSGRSATSGVQEDPARPAVYGATVDNPDKHFIGWLGEVDPEALFASGRAWGLSVVRRRP